MSPSPARQPFGYKTGWIAARGTDTGAVADALGLADRRSASWSEGVDAAYRGGVFVCPPVDGWVLALGQGLMLERPDAVELSAALAEEVQLFLTHRVTEAHHWSCARDGVLVRAFEFDFEGGRLTANAGEPTEIELATPEIAPAVWHPTGTFPFEAYEPPNPPVRTPNEQSVMTVAAAWSLDPTQLDGDDDRPGILGRRVAAAPAAPSERQRRWRFR